MSCSSDDDDSGFEVYTNVAKNMKDLKRLYMRDVQSVVHQSVDPAISSIDAAISAVVNPASSDPGPGPSQEEPSLSPPKLKKTADELLTYVLSDDEFQEPATIQSKRSTRASSRLQRVEPPPAMQLPAASGRGRKGRRGRGQTIDSQRTAASMELLSTPALKYVPRKAINWAVDDSSFDDSLVVEEEDDNFEISVKVCWKSGKIYKFPIRKYQKLSSIFEHFANLENVPQSQILMSLKDNIISRDDTPDTLKLTIANIIEGGIVTDYSVAIAKPTLAETDEDTIELKIRTRDSKTSTVITLQKTQKISVMMTKYSEQMEIPLDRLKFSFDGDVLNPNDTPEDLDLEGGEMIDLVVLK